ncbi:hypothetical protein B0H11DRAFT_37214 [Mycena galericulata]|nr:hypothetical protein B0H11DRAFT_37214 [Mycena galericulata]
MKMRPETPPCLGAPKTSSLSLHVLMLPLVLWPPSLSTYRRTERPLPQLRKALHRRRLHPPFPAFRPAGANHRKNGPLAGVGLILPHPWPVSLPVPPRPAEKRGPGSLSTAGDVQVPRLRRLAACARARPLGPDQRAAGRHHSLSGVRRRERPHAGRHAALRRVLHDEAPPGQHRRPPRACAAHVRAGPHARRIPRGAVPGAAKCLPRDRDEQHQAPRVNDFGRRHRRRRKECCC